jgi:hypothetical protein
MKVSLKRCLLLALMSMAAGKQTLDDWSVTRGDWKEDKGFISTSEGELLSNSELKTDFLVQFKLRLKKVEKDGWITIFLCRSEDEKTYYRCDMFPNSRSFQIIMSREEEHIPLGVQDVSVPVNRWFLVVITRERGNFRFQVANARILLDNLNINALTRGKLSLFVHKTEAEFKDILIRTR